MKYDARDRDVPKLVTRSSRLKDDICFQIRGIVDHGDQRGRLLGFPTANVAIPQNGNQKGVWAGTVQLCSQQHGPIYVAAISIGDRPTYYAKGQRLLEANLLDFNGDLYGQAVVVTLRSFIRPQRRFTGTSELVDQIEDDVAHVRKWAGRSGLGNPLDEGHETHRRISKSPPVGRPYAIGPKRSNRGAEYAEQVRKKRAARRTEVIGDAAEELARTGNLTHEALARETGIPVGFLQWKYPTAESLWTIGTL